MQQQKQQNWQQNASSGPNDQQWDQSVQSEEKDIIHFGQQIKKDDELQKDEDPPDDASFLPQQARRQRPNLRHQYNLIKVQNSSQRCRSAVRFVQRLQNAIEIVKGIQNYQLFLAAVYQAIAKQLLLQPYDILDIFIEKRQVYQLETKNIVITLRQNFDVPINLPTKQAAYEYIIRKAYNHERPVFSALLQTDLESTKRSLMTVIRESDWQQPQK